MTILPNKDYDPPLSTFEMYATMLFACRKPHGGWPFEDKLQRGKQKNSDSRHFRHHSVPPGTTVRWVPPPNERVSRKEELGTTSGSQTNKDFTTTGSGCEDVTRKPWLCTSGHPRR